MFRPSQDYINYKATDFLLDDSFLNYCNNTPADTAFWEAWQKQHPEMKAEVAQAKKMYCLLAVKSPVEEKIEAATRLKRAIGSILYHPVKEEPATIHYLSTGRRKWLIRISTAAACIAIFISSALWLKHPGKYNTPVAEFTKTNFLKPIVAKDSPRKEVQLPDGSIAVLNDGSVLKIAANYNESTRWVYLEGEAFFSVKPDAQKPFVVITGKTATSALGTTFKVKNYTGGDICTVMLATGKVKVQQMVNNENKPDLILMPGEQASIGKDSLLSRSAFDAEILKDWRAMRIIFDKAKLGDIVKTLEFYYGVQVRLQNRPATEIAFTGKFFEKSLQEVLEAISFTNKFRYTQTGNTVSILFQ